MTIIEQIKAVFTRKQTRTVQDIIAPFGDMLVELRAAVEQREAEKADLDAKSDRVEALRIEAVEAANKAAEEEQLDIYNEKTAVERQIDHASRMIPKLESFLDA